MPTFEVLEAFRRDVACLIPDQFARFQVVSRRWNSVCGARWRSGNTDPGGHSKVPGCISAAAQRDGAGGHTRCIRLWHDVLRHASNVEFVGPPGIISVGCL